MGQKDYLLDTNILGYLAELNNGGKSSQCLALKQHLEAVQTNKAKIFLCPISVGEIERGLLIAPYPDLAHQALARSIYIMHHSFVIDNNIAQKCYAVIWARLFEKYAPREKKQRGNSKKRISEWIGPTDHDELQVQENDLWITAVAMSHHLVFVTNDKMTRIKSVVTPEEVEFEDWLV